MSGVTDFHSHILPGIDDGSASAEESVAMLRLEAEHGVRTVVATPHFYPRYDTPEHFLQKRDRALQVLREATTGQEDLPQILTGAEVYYFTGISESDAISALTIGSTRAILIEMPPAPWTEAMYRELEGIYVKRGLTPIIAHLDRYIRPFRTHRIPQRLAELPVLVQANAAFFTNRGTSPMAMRLLKDGHIHLLGSDCHDLHGRRPDLGAAVALIEKRLGSEAIRHIRCCEQEILAQPI